jgi:hypothetical protein
MLLLPYACLLILSCKLVISKAPRSDDRFIEKFNRMNKRYKYLAVIIVILLSIAIYKLKGHGDQKMYDRNNMVKVTGITQFVLRSEYHDDRESYFNIQISDSDKRKLISKFQFDDNLEKLNGKIPCPFIRQKKTYKYCVNLTGYGPYGYSILTLEKTGNGVEYFELYGY